MNSFFPPFAILIALPTMATAGDAGGTEADAQPHTLSPPASEPNETREIVVLGRRENIPADDSLDEATIAAYGLDTVGEVVEEFSARLARSRDGPLVLVNGQPTSSIEDIRDLPAEAIHRIDLLDRSAASRLGVASSRRVVNITIKPDLVQTTMNAGAMLATAGGTAGGDGELSLLHQVDGNREIIGVRGKYASPLDESERRIVSLPGESAYPASYRTLRPRQKVLAASVGIVRKLSPESKLGLTLKAERANAEGRNGPARSSESEQLSGPLRDHSTVDTLKAGLTFNAPVGASQLSILATGDFGETSRTTQLGVDSRQFAGLETSGLADPAVDPSTATDPPLFATSRTRSSVINIEAISTHMIGALPAGVVGLTIKADWQRERSASSADSVGAASALSIGRDSVRLAAGLSVPLLESDGLAGSLGLDLLVAVRRIDLIGTVTEFSVEPTWAPADILSFDFKFASESLPPAALLLAQAPVTLPGVRVVDFVRGETALVDYVAGGNPDLATSRSKTMSAAVNLAPVQGVIIGAEYARVRTRGAVSSLPPASAEIQAAFPDRFERDVSGRLVRVDARAINFAREMEDTLNWSIDVRRTLGKGGAGASAVGDDQPPRSDELSAGARALRLTARLAHRWLLRSDRQARNGLPIVDLLNGGAPGYGSGLSRHSLNFSGGFGWRGLGAQLTGSWQSGSTIRAQAEPGSDDLRFAPMATLNVRAFANLAAFLPNSGFFRGSRLTFSATNLFDKRQRVTDGKGAVPLAYQAALVDPVGRTITLSFRKIF